MKFINNIKASFASAPAEVNSKDRADLVQTVLLIAGFAIAALVLVNWLSTAILNKGADAASCIEGANTYTTNNSEKNCASQDHAKTSGYENQDSYKDRFKKSTTP